MLAWDLELTKREFCVIWTDDLEWDGLNSKIYTRDPPTMSWSRVVTHIFFEVDKSARNVMKNRHICAPSKETILWM